MKYLLKHSISLIFSTLLILLLSISSQVRADEVFTVDWEVVDEATADKALETDVLNYPGQAFDIYVGNLNFDIGLFSEIKFDKDYFQDLSETMVSDVDDNPDLDPVIILGTITFSSGAIRHYIARVFRE